LPTANVNGISISYEIDGEDTGKGAIVLINGLADDLLSWGFQIPALVAAGYRVLRFDNRGIGKTDRPAGPYTSKLMADDAKALVDHLGLSGFHLMGVSMGGMIAQEYAVAHPGDLKSVTLACTYGKADAFCQTMFAMWGDLAQKVSVPFVMRDVALWAFTGPFFEDRPGDAAAFAAAMAALDQDVPLFFRRGLLIHLVKRTAAIEIFSFECTHLMPFAQRLKHRGRRLARHSGCLVFRVQTSHQGLAFRIGV